MGRQSEEDPSHRGPTSFVRDPGDYSHSGSYSDDERGREQKRLDLRDKALAEERAKQQQAEQAEAHQVRERSKVKAQEDAEKAKLKYAEDRAAAAAKDFADHEAALKADAEHAERERAGLNPKHKTGTEWQYERHQKMKAEFAAKQRKEQDNG
jgi:hypothetical protein